MNIRFEAPTDQITASQTACGTVSVEETDDGSNGTPETPPTEGAIGLLDDPLVLGGVGVLVLIVVALLVI